MATLTFAYTDSTVVIGPLSLRAEPGAYDLCAWHVGVTSAPRGWEMIRLPLDAAEPRHSTDDLLALADAVREVGLAFDDPPARRLPAGIVEVGRKGHLTVLADADSRG